MKNPLLFLTIGAIVALFILAGFVFWQREQKMPQVQPLPSSPPQAHSQPTPRPTPATKPSSDPTATWKTYRSKQYGFEFKYPSNWILMRQGSEALNLWSPENYQTPATTDVVANLSVDIEPNPNNLPFSSFYEPNSELLSTLKKIDLPGGLKAYHLLEPGIGDCCEGVYIPAPRLFIHFTAICLYRSGCEEYEVQRKIIESIQLLK